MMMRQTQLALSAACLLHIAGAAALAQGEPPPPSTQPAGEPEGVLSREAAKTMLQRRLEEAERMQKEIKSAIEKLDAGATPREVLRDLPMPGRRFGDRPGGLRERLEDRRDGRGPGGPPGEDRAMGPGGPPGDGLQGEDRQRTLRALREELPEIADAIEELRRQEPRAADRLVERVLPRVRQAMGDRARDEELATLRLREVRSMFALMRAARTSRLAGEGTANLATPKPNQAELEAALRKAAENAFDDRLAVQRREADLLERRVRDLRDDIAKREADKAKLIDEGVERIKQGGPVLPPSEPGPRRGEPGGPPPGEPR